MSLTLTHYPVFLLAAATAILTPGPGVLLTINNALRFGVWRAQLGILGIGCGSALIAGVSATGLGLLLSASPKLFAALRLLGALYLIFLGLRLWRRAESAPLTIDTKTPKHGQRFLEAFGMQLTNPQALLFFGALLPQFLDAEVALLPQFLLLIAGYVVLLFVIHSGYGALAAKAAQWLQTPAAHRGLQRTSALAFLGFGLWTAAAALP